LILKIPFSTKISNFAASKSKNRMLQYLEQEVLNYSEAHSSPEMTVLQQISRETYAKILLPQMLSGHLQGNILSTFSRMIQAKRMLEIGTFTAYSAICLAQGLAEGGELHTIESNEELEVYIRKHIKAADLEGVIRLHIGPAAQIIPTLDMVFDLVFIDADKLNYLLYYELVLPKVRKGGFIIADNVLWSGKVLTDAKDKDTMALKRFNQYVRADERVFNTLFPLRDGLMVIQKL
jgi:caffeoyl-CoA O-methyltransferase